MKRFFMAGLLIWAPIGVTVAVIRFIVGVMDSFLAWIPSPYQPAHWLPFPMPGFSFLVVLMLIIVTGMLAANFMGKKLLAWWESLLSHIPLVRSIYQGVKQSLEVVLSPQGQSFRQVLLIEYPKDGCWSLAFRTSEGPKTTSEAVGESLVSVFIPTTPNPTSGFLLLVPEQQVRPIDLTVDQALKYIVSLGTVLERQPLQHEESAT